MKEERHYDQSTRDKFKKNIFLVNIENTHDFDSWSIRVQFTAVHVYTEIYFTFYDQHSVYN